jgi:hypothetical protein
MNPCPCILMFLYAVQLMGPRLMKVTSALTGFLLLLVGLGDIPGAHADELVQVAPHRTAIWPRSSEATPGSVASLCYQSGRVQTVAWQDSDEPGEHRDLWGTPKPIVGWSAPQPVRQSPSVPTSVDPS